MYLIEAAIVLNIVSFKSVLFIVLFSLHCKCPKIIYKETWKGGGRDYCRDLVD